MFLKGKKGFQIDSVLGYILWIVFAIILGYIVFRITGFAN